MMLLRFLKPKRTSAPIARQRLKVLLEHEHMELGKPDLIASLREEILAVIHKHVAVDPENVRVSADRTEKTSTLKVDVEIPLSTLKAAAA
jgi:cell division topological specificity factor